MKRFYLIAVLIIWSVVGFSSCSKEDPEEELGYIKISLYDGTPDMDYFTQMVCREWESAGHKVELRFAPWDPYEKLPDEDASLLIYDGVAYTALLDKGYLQPLSNAPEKYSFDWTYSLADGGKYVAPFLLCSSFLIYDKDDEELSQAKYVTDVAQEVAVPLKSMCAYYYVNYLIAKDGPSAVLKDLTTGLDETALEPVRYMAEHWLGDTSFENASLSKYNGPARFNDGSVGAIFNFSETSYDLTSKNLSATMLAPYPEVKNWSYNIDYMSVRSGISEYAAKLCEELIAIIGSEEFQYEYLYHEGKPLYSLPANKAAFRRLADKDPLYATFYDYSSQEMNRPMVLGAGFYEQVTVFETMVKESVRPKP